MKALFIWDSDYPWDIRVEKICNTLLENGWEVHLVCRNRLGRLVEETYNDICIHRLPFLTKKLGRLNSIFSFPAFFNPLWLLRINKVAKQHHVDIIIVRDLPMAPAAIFVGKLHKIPVILDMAECYPELIRLIWKYEPFQIKNVFIRNPIFADIVEHFVLNNVDHIFVMVKESKNRLINKRISADKITIVSNTPVLERFQDAKATFPGTIGQNKGKLIMLYVGFVNFSRGLDTVLESLQKFIEINNKVYLVIIGTGNAEKHLQNMVKRFKLERYVGFEGWVDNKIIPEYVISSDVCLVPHHKCGHWDNTIPNKLFDYMAASKPVLVSNVEPMKRIVEGENCGLVYEDKNTESFISQIVILQDLELRRKLGLNGAKAVKERYNWDNESVAMLNSIKGFIRQ